MHGVRCAHTYNYKLLKYRKMKNEEIKQQETTAQCTICIVMRCTCKWMLATGMLNLLLILFAVIVNWVITGDDVPGDWADNWLGFTLLELMLTGVAYLMVYFKDVKEFMCDVMRCSLRFWL